MVVVSWAQHPQATRLELVTWSLAATPATPPALSRLVGGTADTILAVQVQLLPG